MFHRTSSNRCGTEFSSPVTLRGRHAGRSFFFGQNPLGLLRRHSDHHPMNSTSLVATDHRHVRPQVQRSEHESVHRTLSTAVRIGTGIENCKPIDGSLACDLTEIAIVWSQDRLRDVLVEKESRHAGVTRRFHLARMRWTISSCFSDRTRPHINRTVTDSMNDASHALRKPAS